MAKAIVGISIFLEQLLQELQKCREGMVLKCYYIKQQGRTRVATHSLAGFARLDVLLL